MQQVPPGISPENIFWLLQLRELAVRNDIRLLLARSPLNERAVTELETREHLDLLNRSIDSYFALAPEFQILMRENPFFESDLFVPGDKDHANTSGAAKMTRYYAEAIRQALEKGQ